MIWSELRASAWKYATYALAVLAVAAAITATVFHVQNLVLARDYDAAKTDRDQARAEVDALNGVLESERSKGKALAAIAAQYEKEKADVQATADRTIAELRSGHLRLRKLWTCPVAPAEGATDATASELDGQAELREQGAVDLVRLAAEADAQIRGLQAVIEADRRP